jgi:translation initiation factor IF-2
VLAVFNQEKFDKQLVGGRVSTGVFRPKTACDIVRGDTTIGSGRILGLREKKNEAMVAEKGKEIGVLVSATIAVMVGDKVIIRK